MKIEEQIKQKLEEAIDILKKFGMPSAQQNERTAYCLLSLLNVTPEKESREVDLFPPVDQSKVVQLADGRNIDRETGEVLTDANGVQYVDGDLFISEPPDDYETGVIGNNEV